MKLLSWISLLVCLIVSTTTVAKSAPDLFFNELKAQGASQFSADAGEKLWSQSVTHAKSNQQLRSCSSCHAKSHKDNGKHIKTAKVIAPMASSVNPDRYTSVKKMKKWFLRNCKWTFNRECSPQEQGDLLTYLLAH
jgi:cytochrome c553